MQCNATRDCRRKDGVRTTHRILYVTRCGGGRLPFFVHTALIRALYGHYPNERNLVRLG